MPASKTLGGQSRHAGPRGPGVARGTFRPRGPHGGARVLAERQQVEKEVERPKATCGAQMPRPLGNPRFRAKRSDVILTSQDTLGPVSSSWSPHDRGHGERPTPARDVRALSPDPAVAPVVTRRTRQRPPAARAPDHPPRAPGNAGVADPRAASRSGARGWPPDLAAGPAQCRPPCHRRAGAGGSARPRPQTGSAFLPHADRQP